jgi:hypothetical protein
MEMGVSYPTILAREVLGQTGTMQDNIAILAPHQPVKNELTVGFPTPQEDTSCKELEDPASSL